MIQYIKYCMDNMIIEEIDDDNMDIDNIVKKSNKTYIIYTQNIIICDVCGMNCHNSCIDIFAKKLRIA